MESGFVIDSKPEFLRKGGISSSATSLLSGAAAGAAGINSQEKVSSFGGNIGKSNVLLNKLNTLSTNMNSSFLSSNSNPTVPRTRHRGSMSGGASFVSSSNTSVGHSSWDNLSGDLNIEKINPINFPQGLESIVEGKDNSDNSFDYFDDNQGDSSNIVTN